jgi:ABC-type transport system involved in cytochrome bd biosynthesis fused ATPase/permease subunit
MQIQQTIRADLSHATIIAIAHRLKVSDYFSRMAVMFMMVQTILDYDRVLVLDQGQIKEFDSPLRLLQRPGGLFNELCRKSAGKYNSIVRRRCSFLHSDWPMLRAMAERRSASQSSNNSISV